MRHLRQLRSLSINATMRPETFVEGIASLRMLSSLTHLELHAVAPPPRPRKSPCIISLYLLRPGPFITYPIFEQMLTALLREVCLLILRHLFAVCFLVAAFRKCRFFATDLSLQRLKKFVF